MAALPHVKKNETIVVNKTLTTINTQQQIQNDGISVFAIAEDGTLTKTSYFNTGKHPRNFIITPNGKYLLVACRDDNFVEVLLRDPATGALNDTGERIAVPRPVCIKFANQE